jgi:myo-inositol-1(or 4)-monophosphatase
MIPTAIEWQTLIDTVRQTSRDIFAQVHSGRQESEHKEDGSLVTQTDTLLQTHIATALVAQFPNIPVLGEEMRDDEQAGILATGNCWILDPLDGTSNFSHGIPFFSVSLALMLSGKIVAGMVFDPSRDELFSALEGDMARLNNTPIATTEQTSINTLKKVIAVIDTKRLMPQLACAIVTEHPYHSQRSFGSVALDWCWLATGRIQTYLHGKQKLWDFAAGAFIAQQTRCLTSTLEQTDILALPLDLTPRSAVGATAPLTAAWQDWIACHI